MVSSIKKQGMVCCAPLLVHVVPGCVFHGFVARCLLALFMLLLLLLGRGHVASAFGGGGRPPRSAPSPLARAPPPPPATPLTAPVTVASLASTLRSLSPGSPGPPAVAEPLSRIDSRALAALLKELRFFRGSGGGGGRRSTFVDRAAELFDWLRSLPFPGHPLAARLLDVYTYTTAIAACGGGGSSGRSRRGRGC